MRKVIFYTPLEEKELNRINLLTGQEWKDAVRNYLATHPHRNEASIIQKMYGLKKGVGKRNKKKNTSVVSNVPTILPPTSNSPKMVITEKKAVIRVESIEFRDMMLIFNLK